MNAMLFGGNIMKISELCETTAASVAAIATPVGGLVSRSQYNSDGTPKNALDSDNLLSNGKPKKKKRKSN